MILSNSIETLFYSDMGIFLYLLPVTISACFGFLLLLKNNQDSPQFFLSMTLLIYSLSLLAYFIYDRYIVQYYSEPLRALDSLLSVPVVITSYFYYYSVMKLKKVTSRLVLYHILPYLALVLLSVLIQGIYGNLFGLTDLSNPSKYFFNVVSIMAFIYLLVYECIIVVDIIKMYLQYRTFIYSNYSFREGVNLRRVPAIFLIMAILAILNLAGIVDGSVILKVIFGIFSIILIFPIFLLGLNQDKLPYPEEKEYPVIEKDIKSTELKDRLLKYFEEQKPYLNKDLKMQDLAQALFTNRSYISHVLNKDFNSSFYTFINNYRIEYAIKLMEEKPDLSVDYYVNASGFKSRSVFFLQFKVYKKCTPYTYLSRK